MYDSMIQCLTLAHIQVSIGVRRSKGRSAYYLFIPILPKTFLAKVSLWDSRQNIWLIFPHTRVSVLIGGRSGERRWAALSVVGARRPTFAPAALRRRRRPRGLRAVEQLQLYGEGSRD